MVKFGQRVMYLTVSGDLGNAPMTQTAGAEPSSGLTRGTPTCGDHWKHTPSAWRRNAGAHAVREVDCPLLNDSLPYVDELLREPTRKALQDMETPLRLRP